VSIGVKVFCGCRHRARWFYRDEMQAWSRLASPSALAFSPCSHRCASRISADGDGIWDAIRTAYIYVCGDGGCLIVTLAAIYAATGGCRQPKVAHWLGQRPDLWTFRLITVAERARAPSDTMPRAVGRPCAPRVSEIVATMLAAQLRQAVRLENAIVFASGRADQSGAASAVDVPRREPAAGTAVDKVTRRASPRRDRSIRRRAVTCGQATLAR
jgi:hypothetical protein